MNRRCFLQAIIGLFCLVVSFKAMAAIQVPQAGVTNGFAVVPTGIGEWCTLSAAGGATNVTTLEQMDAFAQTIDATSSTNVALLPSDTGAFQTLAGWYNGAVFTRPTQVLGGVLMAALQNVSGSSQTSLVVQYDLSLSASVTEEIAGQVVYFSTNGMPNSWTRLGQFMAGGTINFSVPIGTWTNGAPLYLMWLDDNGSGTPDTLVTMDNVVFGFPAADAPPQIVTPLANQTNNAGTTATFTLSAAGTQPLAYYWYTNNVLASASANNTFTSAPLVVGSNFLCTVIVSNALGTVTNSAVAWGVVPIPSVSLSNPADGQQFVTPATVNLQAAANPGNGASVAGVGFYSTNSGWLATAVNAPYTATASGLSAGTYGYYAMVTNNFGAIAVSATNVITVQDPVTGGGWVAFIDHRRGPQTSNNVTVLDLFADNGARLTNVLNGQSLGAGLTITRTGYATEAGTMGVPNVGTPAYQVFNNMVDFYDALASYNTVLLYGSSSGQTPAVYGLTFTNLNPAKRYSLKATAVRGGGYTNRWTVCAIQGADTFLEAHTPGCLVAGDARVPAGTITNGQVAFNSGDNLVGDLIDWEQINPGADGNFSVEMRQWLGAIPGGTNAGNNYAYALGAVRLEELPDNSPPLITAPLRNQTNTVGASVTFSVNASGTAPLVYYWFTNGVFVIANDTGSFAAGPLKLGSNFLCTVVVSNAFGTAASSASAWGTASVRWTAYNDHTVGPLTGSNVTTYPMRASGSGGRLRDQATGTDLPATLLVTSGGSPASIAVQYGAQPAAGSATYNIFNGYVDFWTSGNSDNGSLVYARSNHFITLTFTNLDLTKRYSFRGSSIRAGTDLGTPTTNYRQRWTLAVLSGAAYFTDAHSTGCVTAVSLPASGLATGQAAYNGGMNVTNSDTVGWDNIIPGPNGTFSITSTQYLGAIWGGETANVLDYPGYAINGFRLEQFPGGPLVALTSPTNGAVINAQSSLALTATASSDGGISRVDFYAGTNRLGVSLTSPYGITWTNVPAGIHQLYAVASDNAGNSGTSAVAQVVALPPGIRVGLTGYTNNFSSAPSPSEWATANSGGSAGALTTAAGVDSVAQTNSASLLTTALPVVTGNPAAQNQLPVWSSDGFLQHSPATIAYNRLLATFVNNVGADATSVRIRYSWYTNNVAENVPGHRAYYSLTGTPGSWTVIPALCSQPGGVLDTIVALNSPWKYSERLYVLWIDANFSGTDMICQIDNFYVAAITPQTAVTLVSPLEGQNFLIGTPVSFSATASSANGITSVAFYTNNSLFFTDYASPYSSNVASLPIGTYSVYAMATDALGLTLYSATNTFVVSPPYIVYNGGTYLESFDSMGATGTSTVPGWFVGPTTNGVGAIGLTTLAAGNGSTTLVTNWNLGSLGSTDRALGSQAGGAAGGDLNLEVRILNNTVSNLTSFALTYDGEQWRAGGSSVVSEFPQYLTLFFSTNGYSFVPMPASLTFTSRVDSILSALDGNLATNRTAGLSGIYTPADPIPPGVIFCLRWYDTNNSGQDHQLGIDNVSFAAVSYSSLELACSLSSPTNNQVFVAPTNVSLLAATSGSPAATNVDFYANGVLIGSSTSSPYSLAWSNPPVGNITLTAVATGDGGVTATSAVVNITVLSNAPPSMSLINPAEGSRYMAPANIVINATATDDFGISSVAFYAGSTKLGEATKTPYSWNWNGVPAGDYQLQAVATDIYGLSATSAVINLTVTNNALPLVSLTGPTNQAVIAAPTNVLVTATASDSDGAVTKVEFYLNGSKLGESAAQPYSMTWSNVIIGGVYSLYAVATDNAGARATSAVINVTVNGLVAPVVAITNPLNNATFTTPATVDIRAMASDSDGTVTNVEFYAGGLLLGNATGVPYNFAWTNVSIGSYALTAVASDNSGMRATSAPVSISVISPIGIPVGITYGCNSLPPVTDWSTLALGSGGTAYGNAAQLDAGVTNLTAGAINQPLGAVADYVTRTTAGWNSIAQTVYLRVTTAGASLLMATLANSTPGTLTTLNVSYKFSNVSNTTEEINGLRAYYSVSGAAGSWKVIPEFSTNATGLLSATLDLGAWPSGSLMYIVWADDNGNSVTDGAWILDDFLAEVPGPMARITSPANNALLVLPDSFPITASVASFSNTVTNVTFSANGIPLGTVTNSPYQFLWTNATPGTYQLRAVATDNTGFSATSAAITVRVQSNTPPAVAITSPPNGSGYTAPSDITILVAASDSEGSVTNLDLLANGVLIVRRTVPSFSYVWPSVPVGIYDLTAVAADNLGYQTTSSVARVFVMASSAPTVHDFVPASGAVSNLGQIAVNFSEPVDGVKAADLLVNGHAASRVTGSNATYVFEFPQPMDGTVVVTWSSTQAIVDRESPPKAFDGSLSGESAQYTLTDTVAPIVTQISPTPGASVPVLTRVEITFSEPVTGVDAGDLLLNNLPAASVNGAQAGPYVFEFLPAASGTAQITWAANHGIHDLAQAQNALAGSAWSYVVNPATTETDVVINEIMYHPASENSKAEFVELHNHGPQPVRLLGWRITGAVDFTLPDVAIAAGGYLVVAADLATFNATYPGVTNVLGSWAGRLSNRDDNVRLRNALGTLIDSVHYATEGDWAIRQRGPLDNGSYGWEWYAPHDGRAVNTATGATESNKTLELMNPVMPNENGQNWAPSAASGGTPGRANAAATNDIAPLITEMMHSPAIPNATQAVTITARVMDEAGAPASVLLYYRDATATTPPAFGSTNMFDDGLHNDGLAGDGLYGVVLPAQSLGTVIEFYVSASDVGGRTRTWPAAARQSNGSFAQTANAHYQVDVESNNSFNMPYYRLVLTGAEANEILNINSASDAEMNITFITSDGTGIKVRYNSSVRIRGAGSRGRPTKNWRVNIPMDRKWNNLSEINFNTQYIHAQMAGSIVSLKSGLPCAATRPVQLRLNGVNRAPSGLPPQGNGDGAGFGTYLLVEPINGEWAANHLPEDSGGNPYRGSVYPWTANLDYLGTNPQSYINAGYSKTANQSENDWNDLINLTSALSASTPDASYVQAVEQNANVQMWMRYFAVGTVLSYFETSLFRGVGDDYAMYRGVKDPRFLLVPHDFDTILGQGDSAPGAGANWTIWHFLTQPPTTASGQFATFLNRFMAHPDFAPLYYAELKRLCDTTYSPVEMNATLDQALGGWVPASTITTMKTYVANRNTYIRSQIPLSLTISTGLGTQNGYFYTTSSNVTLTGRAHAIDTRSVRAGDNPAVWSAFSAAWTNTVTLKPGINRIQVQALNANKVSFDSATVEIWYDAVGTSVSGVIATDTTWLAASGPYNVTGSIMVNNGATLTIQAGTTLFLGSGVNINVANGGRLLAEGTAAAPIRFTRAPAATTSWGGMTINGGTGSPETRIAYARFEYNASTAIHSASGTVFLDDLTFGSTGVPYLSLDNSSFVVQHCTFPATTGSFEPLHGTGGVRADGQGIFRRNFVGRVTGYNDAFDFTGGNRPSPILQVINNVFMGSEDDLLDLDGTDTWVEGNIFLNTHRGASSPDSSSAVSGGDDSGQTSEITVVGNLMFNVDQAALAKLGNYYAMINNTVVKQNGVGSRDTETAVVIVADDTTAEGRGMYLEGNIVYEAEKLVRNQTNSVVTWTNNLVYGLTGSPWTGLGGNNENADPLFKHVPAVAETTNFTTWAQAQVLWDWLSLRTGSPAAGKGAGGRDWGAVNARGVTVAGVPDGVTPSSSVTLKVGFNITGNGMVSGFPNGSGYTHYKWRLDGGAWSAETSIGTPIVLSGLAAGPHYVEVAGKNDAGLYQDDAALVVGEDALVTRTRTWIVNPTAPSVRLNEVLARNDTVMPVNGKYPDLIELYNSGPVAADLSGMSLSDSAANPQKFIFPPGSVLAAGDYLVVYADSEVTPAGYHTGFTLKQEGDDLYLFAAGGRVLDAAAFGPQLADRSIGRQADGSWALTVPTFGAANRAVATGNPQTLKINEWLAASGSGADFIELFNADAAPVDLGGLYLTDTPESLQSLHQIAPLSFIAGSGYAVFLADANAAAGPEHLGFQLAGEQGMIGLFDGRLARIDLVSYGPQTNELAFGRSPNASTNLAYLTLATPGGPNPTVTATFGTQIVINEVMAKNIRAVTNSSGATPEWIELYNPTTNAVALGGMSLSDDSAQPRKYVFPAGLTLPSRYYLQVWCDDAAPASTNNTGFAITANGGAIFLYDQLTNSGPIDYVFYGVQANDYSIGRVSDGSTNWVLAIPTPASQNIPAALGSVARLKINEWMADPASGADWFELFNPELQPVALGGLWLTDDTRTLASRMRYQIPPLSFLGTDLYGYERFWADNAAVAEPTHCNFALRAGGEYLGVSWSDGTPIDGVQFGPQVQGVSEGRLPDGASNVVAFATTATPGDANYLPLTSVVINEVLSASPTNLNLEDAIELHNSSAVPVDVTGWFLSDARRSLKKFQIPETVITNPGPVYVTNRAIIPPGGYLVCYEYQFNANPDEPISFNLDGAGSDEVYLSATDAAGNLTGYRAEVAFDAADPGVSFGRYTNSAGKADFVALTQRTFGVDNPDSLPEFRQGGGLPNAGPVVGPLVFSEIMYHPPDFPIAVDNMRDEFVELYNPTTNTMALYDPANPTNTWRLRGGVDFDFPTNVTLPPGGYLVVVSFDPVADTNSLAAFRAVYPQLPANAALFGPYAGKLANNGESIELKKPGVPEAGRVPYILVEQVKYNQVAPWDAQADGTGYSLRRLAPMSYGNEPTNWVAGAPSPGCGFNPNADSDGDGIPDWWVQQYFGHASGLVGDQSRAGDDPDFDGMNNQQEYLAGTSPVDPSSALRILSMSLPVAGANAPMEFLAMSNHSYTVEYKNRLDTNAWNTLQSYPPAATNRIIQVPVPAGGSSGFLRLRTP